MINIFGSLCRTKSSKIGKKIHGIVLAEKKRGIVLAEKISEIVLAEKIRGIVLTEKNPRDPYNISLRL